MLCLRAVSSACREVLLSSVNVGVLGALFTFGAAPRPSNLGLRDIGVHALCSQLAAAALVAADWQTSAALDLQKTAAGSNTKTLGLCPQTPNCISTAEEVNDAKHYVPGWCGPPPGVCTATAARAALTDLASATPECWRDRLFTDNVALATDKVWTDPCRTYNPEDRRSKQPITKESAMSELAAAISSTKPDNFTPTIITKTDDYLYAEYQSPTFGFIDDVEFYFPPGKSTVEYRSASRIGESDGAQGPCMPCDQVLCIDWSHV